MKQNNEDTTIDNKANAYNGFAWATSLINRCRGPCRKIRSALHDKTNVSEAWTILKIPLVMAALGLWFWLGLYAPLSIMTSDFWPGLAGLILANVWVYYVVGKEAIRKLNLLPGDQYETTAEQWHKTLKEYCESQD